MRKPRECFEADCEKNLNLKWKEILPSAENFFSEITKIHVHNFNMHKARLSEPPVKLTRNMRVLVFKPLSPGQSKKCGRKWQGPFRVIKSTSQDVYLLKSELTNRRLKRNIKLIRVIPKTNPDSPVERISGPRKLMQGETDSVNEQTADSKSKSENSAGNEGADDYVESGPPGPLSSLAQPVSFPPPQSGANLHGTSSARRQPGAKVVTKLKPGYKSHAGEPPRTNSRPVRDKKIPKRFLN